jgi:hypothetical protein
VPGRIPKNVVCDREKERYSKRKTNVLAGRGAPVLLPVLFYRSSHPFVFPSLYKDGKYRTHDTSKRFFLSKAV